MHGCTALHLAARWGHVDVLQELLCHGGADWERRDAKGPQRSCNTSESVKSSLAITH